MSIKQDKLNALDSEALDVMVEEVNSGVVGDAVRMGYLAQAQKILRRLYKNGVNYAGTGDFITIARNKARIPDPQPAKSEGVEAGHTPGTPAAEGTDTPKRKPGRPAKAKAPTSSGPEESA